MSAIEWTDETWNPTTGCDRVSPGCDHCYALTLAKRLKGMGQEKYQNDGDPRTSGPGFRLTVHPDTLDVPFRWRKPRRVFVNSMSDLFHQDVPDEFIGRVFDVMARTPQHTYQVLTKRTHRLSRALGPSGCGFYAAEGTVPCPQPNVWLGVSIESDRYTFRAEHLRRTPAAVRFLSLEPLLGPLPSLDLTDIDWVIVGGESGPGARPMQPGWVRDIRDRCVAADVPFFFKQWGAWRPGPHKGWTHRVHPDGTVTPRPDDEEALREVQERLPDTGWYGMSRVGKAAAGRELDGCTWDEMPALTAPVSTEGETP